MKKWLAILTLVLAVAPVQAVVYEVTKTADTLDGACNDDCSLRDAPATISAAIRGHPGRPAATPAPSSSRHWVFATGLTDVGVELTVEDTATGESWMYGHAGGTTFPTVTDTNAFAVCGS